MYPIHVHIAEQFLNIQGHQYQQKDFNLEWKMLN